MRTCAFAMEITKQRAESLREKMRNAGLYLKGATCSHIARASLQV